MTNNLILDADLPAGFDPDDLDDQLFEDFPEHDPAADLIEGGADDAR